MKKPLLILLCLSVALVPELAAAAGLDSAKTEATNWRAWFYSIVGILAGLYLLYEFVLVWAKRNTWVDVGGAMGWVAGTGACLLLADYFWNMFV